MASCMRSSSGRRWWPARWGLRKSLRTVVVVDQLLFVLLLPKMGGDLKNIEGRKGVLLFVPAGKKKIRFCFCLYPCKKYPLNEDQKNQFVKPFLHISDNFITFQRRKDFYIFESAQSWSKPWWLTRWNQFKSKCSMTGLSRNCSQASSGGGRRWWSQSRWWSGIVRQGPGLSSFRDGRSFSSARMC